KIEVEDGAMKYKNILNSIVRPYTGKQSKASATDVKAILSVLEDFADQIHDCIALGQFRVAFDIFKSALSKLEYVRNYHLIYVDRQDALSHTFHKIIHTFSEEKLPPELILEIKEYLLEVANLSYYHFKDYRYNVIYQLIPYLKANEKGNISSNIENIITKKPAYEKNILVALWIKISGKFDTDGSSFVKSQCSSYLEVADYLIQDSLDHLAIKMLEKLYPTKKYVKDVTNRLLYLYVRTKNHPKLVQIVQVAYASTGEIKYIDILKDELNAVDYYAALDSLQQDLKERSTDPKYLLRIYQKEENWSGIIFLLDQINDIDLTMQYDADLYKNEKKALEELYSLLVSRYLDAYIGDIVADYLMQLRNHFNKKKMSGLTQTIHHLLKTKYAQRPKLIDIFA
ncbi:MAG: hypothetical protein WAU01_06595, partial [Saprospiraceae bacterium]